MTNDLNRNNIVDYISIIAVEVFSKGCKMSCLLVITIFNLS